MSYSVRFRTKCPRTCELVLLVGSSVVNKTSSRERKQKIHDVIGVLVKSAFENCGSFGRLLQHFKRKFAIYQNIVEPQGTKTIEIALTLKHE